MGDVGDLFGDLIQPPAFPGKRKPALRDQPKPQPAVPDAWDAHPRRYYVEGEQREFFTIGNVAVALNRSARSIRLWERNQTIPPATFRAAAPKRSKVKEAGDRLWTRAQVEVMIRAAQEEGVIDGKPPSKAFTAKVVRGFLALQQEHGNS